MADSTEGICSHYNLKIKALTRCEGFFYYIYVMNKSLVIYVLFFILGFNVFGQSVQHSDAKIRAIYIYNFTKYFEWPTLNKSSEFRIGIIADNQDLIMELEKMASLKKVGGLPIKIIPFLKTSDLTEIEMLYVDTKYNPDFKIGQISKNILLVSENEKNLDNAMIAFYVENGNKLKFALNELNVKKAGLKRPRSGA